MEQKTKIITTVLVIILLAILISFIFIFINDKREKEDMVSMLRRTEVEAKTPGDNSNKESLVVDNQVKYPMDIDGKVRTINEKELHLELEDGSGYIVYINPQVQVYTKGSEKAGNLSYLKLEHNVTVTIDAEKKAEKITILN